MFGYFRFFSLLFLLFYLFIYIFYYYNIIYIIYIYNKKNKKKIKKRKLCKMTKARVTSKKIFSNQKKGGIFFLPKVTKIIKFFKKVEKKFYLFNIFKILIFQFYDYLQNSLCILYKSHF